MKSPFSAFRLSLALSMSYLAVCSPPERFLQLAKVTHSYEPFGDIAGAQTCVDCRKQ